MPLTTHEWVHQAWTSSNCSQKIPYPAQASAWQNKYWYQEKTQSKKKAFTHFWITNKFGSHRLSVKKTCKLKEKSSWRLFKHMTYSCSLSTSVTTRALKSSVALLSDLTTDTRGTAASCRTSCTSRACSTIGPSSTLLQEKGQKHNDNNILNKSGFLYSAHIHHSVMLKAL